MNTRQLHSFLAVAECLNFTEAARKLHLAQPSLSRQIRELENELGVKLFYRNNRSVTVTPAGKLLYKEATALISRINGMIEQLHQLQSGDVGKLVIGCLGLEKQFFAGLIKAFRKAHSHIAVRADWILAMSTQIDLLLREELDVVFTLETEVQKYTELAWNAVYSDPIMVVLPSDHRLAGKASINLQELANELFVFIQEENNPGSIGHIFDLCVQKGFYPKITSRSNTLEGLLLAIASGMGITLLSKRMREYAGSELQFIPLEKNIYLINTVAAWKKTNTNPAIPLFLQELQKVTKL